MRHNDAEREKERGKACDEEGKANETKQASRNKPMIKRCPCHTRPSIQYYAYAARCLSVRPFNFTHQLCKRNM